MLTVVYGITTSHLLYTLLLKHQHTKIYRKGYKHNNLEVVYINVLAAKGNIVIITSVDIDS